ncbi:Uncharacterized protein (Fragment), partial [Durusdinium trenchii]
DRGVRQDLTDESRNPSEKVIEEQVQKASTIWKGFNLEEECSLVPSSVMGAAFEASRSRSSASQSQPQQTRVASKRNSRAIASATAAAAPLVVAAKQRAKTAKCLAEAERLLEKAKSDANNLLTKVAPSVCLDDPAEDPTLDVIRTRLTLVQLGQNDQQGAEGEEACREFYHLALQDPYLKDCEATLLADCSAVLTLGRIKYLRNIQMDLQFC